MGIETAEVTLARTLARNIKRHCEARSLSLVDFNHQCGIAGRGMAYRQLLRVVQGSSGVHVKYLATFAKVLGCEPWQLLKP